MVLSAGTGQEGSEMAKIVTTSSPEYMATFTTEQLRALAARTDLIAESFAAQCELILRGES